MITKKQLIIYPQYKTLSENYIATKLTEFLKEDMPDGDKTTELTISKNKLVTAEIQIMEEQIFVGEKIIPHCFGNDCKVTINQRDGNLLSSGDIAGSVTGYSKAILSRERVMLNLIQRLCGIATLSRKFVDIAKPYNVKILDTRKTTPGLRLFEKYAVVVGGAYNHRLNLSEGILIKDNHILAAGSITEAIKCVKKTKTPLKIELEVDNLNQIIEGLEIGVDGFLLDNMNMNSIQRAVSIIRKHKNGTDIFIEVSGGITLINIRQYVDLDVNAISIGAITHQAKSKDIRLEIIT